VRVVATYNLKGGVGKTTAAVNLAHLAAHHGGRTLLWDLDPQGGSSYLLGLEPGMKGGARRLVRADEDPEAMTRPTGRPNLDVLPADFSNRNLDVVLDGKKHSTQRFARLMPFLSSSYRYVVIDCPPSISLVAENVFNAVDMLLVPLIPAPLSVRTFDQITGFVRRSCPQPPDVRAFFSMVDGRKRLHRDLVEQLSNRWPGILHTHVPAAADVERMGTMRAPLTEFAPTSRAAIAFQALWQEVEGNLDEIRAAR
jgi:cellulose biosynthesis protein BcsQ